MDEEMLLRAMEEYAKREEKFRKLEFLESLHHGPLCPGGETCLGKECAVYRIEAQLIRRRAA